ncbi:hypothetical protein ACP70R_047995 [Stipagrostis hirtigluma subsp. patula]
MLGNNKARRISLEKQRGGVVTTSSLNNCHNKSVAELRQPSPTQDPKSSDLHMLHRRKENDEWCLFGDGKSSRSELLCANKEARRVCLEGSIWAIQRSKAISTASSPVFPGIFG